VRGERKTTKPLRIVRLIFEIKTRDRRNRDQECYPLYRGTYEYYLYVIENENYVLESETTSVVFVDWDLTLAFFE
jgi:hypothetical protein